MVVQQTTEGADVSERVHDIDLTSIPAGHSYAEWSAQMRQLDGQLVRVSGCALDIVGTAPSEGFELMPCDYPRYRNDLRKATDSRAPRPPRLLVPPMSRRLEVSLASPDASVLHVVVGRNAVSLTRIRVVGRLRVGKKMIGEFVMSWGAITEAKWERIRGDVSAD